jgi:TPP-dependent pyruvate/acetoin dehydrogenase alpha subunit
MYDPELYRSKEEVERWREHDPLVTFPARLRAAGHLDDTSLTAIEHEIAVEIDAAIAYADEGTLEPVGDLTRFVYSETRPA